MAFLAKKWHVIHPRSQKITTKNQPTPKPNPMRFTYSLSGLVKSFHTDCLVKLKDMGNWNKAANSVGNSPQLTTHCPGRVMFKPGEVLLLFLKVYSGTNSLYLQIFSLLWRWECSGHKELGRTVNRKEVRNILQRWLHNLEDWNNRNEMKFNNGKDKVMHLDIYKKHFYYGL